VAKRPRIESTSTSAGWGWRPPREGGAVSGLRLYPVYVGLQPMEPGWDKGFSAEALAGVDYVLMDPQSIPLPNGGYQRIWELQTYVEDAEEFMAR